MRRLIVLCAWALVCAGVFGCGGSSPPAAAPAAAAPGAPGASTPASGMPGDGSAAAMPGGSTSSSTPASRAAVLAPYLDDQTVAILRLDVAGLSADQLTAQLTKGMQAPGMEEQRAQVQQGIDRLKEVQKQVQELFVVISLSDAPAYPPFGVVKLQPGADAKKVFALSQTADLNAPVDEKAFEDGALVRDNVLVIGNERAIYRFKNGAQPATVPNLEQAFQLAGDTQLQFLYVPTDGARQRLASQTPEIPKDFGIDGPTLLNSVSYLSIGVKMPPGFEMKVEAQGKDAASAQQVHGAITKLFDMFRKAQSAGPGTELVLNALMPKLNNDRLAISLKEGDPIYQRLEAQLTEQLAQT